MAFCGGTHFLCQCTQSRLLTAKIPWCERLRFRRVLRLNSRAPATLDLRVSCGTLLTQKMM